MPLSVRLSSWALSVLCALALLAWFDLQEVRHVNAVTALGAVPTDAKANFAARNALIVPEHITESYHWLLQTQQMFDRREARVRHIGYENAPFGRDVAVASPYRWWLGLLAWGDHVVTGQPMHHAVERAAMFSDPLLHALLLTATAVFVGWRFGAMAGVLSAIAMATLFPFAAAFLPGAPDDGGLAAVVALGSVLLLGGELARPRAAISGAAPVADRNRRWFVAAGIAGGVSLWLSPAHEIPVLAGILLGALVASWLRRPANDESSAVPALPWRAWSTSGAVTTLVAYLVEYFPHHLGGWQLRSVHPLYGVAWLGAGELLAQATGWIETRRFNFTARRLVLLLLAVLAAAALPFALWRLQDGGISATDLWDFRLTKLPGSPLAPSFAAWLRESNGGMTLAVVLLPFTLVMVAAWFLFRRGTPDALRVFLALGLGPMLCTALFALRQIAWWTEADALLLAPLLAVCVVLQHSRPKWIWTALVVLLCLPGVFERAPKKSPGGIAAPSQPEVIALIERDLAGWLALHAPGGHAVFVAPPNETTALSYYGAGDGIATLSWQNKEGLEAAVRILSASTPEEAKALIDRRRVTHIIMPSWDPYLDVYAQMGMGQLDGTFINRLHQWKVPAWLRPAPYVLPIIPGFEQQSVTIFEVVDEQSDAIALSRTAEYFIELGRLDQATDVGQRLRRYPADMNAWIARAEVEAATGDDASLAKSMAILLPYVNAKRDRSLPWDMRVGLAVVLARTKHTEQAQRQIERAIADANEARLRALPTGSLYRLLVLSRAYAMPIKDPTLDQLALALLPSDARAHLAATR